MRSAVFLLLACGLSGATLYAQQASCSVQQGPTDPASQAFERHDYAKAVDLYATRAKADPNDMAAIAGEARSLLAEQQVDAAAQLAANNFALHSKSAELATALGEVRYRQGRLADAVNAYRTAMQIDPCLARTRYDIYRILWVESMRAAAYSQLQSAHGLEPSDPDIHLAWIETLPLAERADKIDGYLTTAKNLSPDRAATLKKNADRLRAILAARSGKGGCRLASSSATTTKLPFEYLEKDEANRYHSVGFDVKINNKANARLELDTGSSGILVDRGAARKAGLVPLFDASIGGIGDEKKMSGFWAYADDFRVGGLEFNDCMIEVSDKRSIIGIDGLIGADVFENYHVQIDFPLRQMVLSPLPLRPGEVAAHGASLNASGVGDAATASETTSGKASAKVAAQPVVRYTDRYVSPEMKSWSPFARVGHQILVNGELKDRKPRLFLVDSGSGWSFLSVPAGKSVGKLHSDPADRVTGLSGQVNKLYTVNNFDLVFGGLRAPFAEVVVMDLDGLSQSDGTEVSGIIGLGTMLPLTMDIDYRDGLIHFTYDPKHGMNAYQGFSH